jgi:hypothetical protein
VLASLVGTQRILEQIILSPYAARFAGLHFDTFVEGPEAEMPPDAFITALEAQRQDVERRLPPSLRSTGMSAPLRRWPGQTIHVRTSLRETEQCSAIVQLNLLSTQLTINDGIQAKDLTSPETGTTNLALLAHLHTRLRILSTWLALFLDLPPTAPAGFTTATYAQMFQAITSLFRCTVLRDPAWDRNAVRQTVDPLATMERIAVWCEQVPAAMGWTVEREEDEVFPKHAQMMRAMRAWLEAEIAAADRLAEAEGPEGQGQGQGQQQVEAQVQQQIDFGTGGGLAGGLPVGDVQLDIPMEFVDDQWWSDIFGNWDPSR